MHDRAPGDQPSTADEPPNPGPTPTPADELPASLNGLLRNAQHLSRPALLGILRADQHRRWQRGERIRIETYLARLPFLAEDEETVLDLIYSEVVIRDGLGERARVEEYIERFPRYEAQLRRQFAINAVLGSDPSLQLDLPTMNDSLEDVRSGETLAVSQESAEDKTPRPTPATLADSPSHARETIRVRFAWPSVPGYKIVSELGRGGMGVVYKATELQLKRTVALKMILGGAHAGPQDLARLRLEAEAVARLQHPNIVQVYRRGEHDDLLYLSLEYIDGGSLAQKLAGMPLPPDQAALMLERLANAIHYAHERGVIHRDLKPANILLASPRRSSSSHGTTETSSLLAETPLGTPKISDFGLAKQMENESGQTRSGAILGTPSYMAPEQASGQTREIGPLTDVYALGAILYEMLTGRPPFRATTAVDTVLQVLSGDPVPPRRLVPKVPRDLETICLKCLQKDQVKRYISALALAEDVRRYLEHRPILARPVGPVERTLKLVRRYPMVSILSAVAVVLFLGGFCGVTWQWRNAEAARKAEAYEKGEKTKALGIAEENLYFNRITLADREWQINNGDGAEKLLDLANGPLRAWEWFYLRRLCHADLLTLPGRDCVAFSPDGKLLASTSGEKTVRLWNARTGALQREFDGAANRVLRLAFSPDSRRLAVAGADKAVHVWDLAAAKETAWKSEDDNWLIDVAFSPDGKWLAAASQTAAYLWNLDTGKKLTLPGAHLGIAFSPDSKLLATPAVEEFAPLEDVEPIANDRLVKLWDVQTGNEVRTFSGPNGHERKVTCVAFSPDGRLVASGGDDEAVKLWLPDSGQEVRTLYGNAGPVVRVVFSPDSQRVAAVGKAVTVWDAPGGKKLRTYRWPHTVAVSGTDLAFSPGGTRLASADPDSVKVWDADNDPEARTCRQRHTREVWGGVAFDPSSQLVASGGDDGTVRVCDAATGREVAACRGHFKPVTGVAFDPDGQLASASEDGTVLFWDAHTGREVRKLQHDFGVAALAFSPRGGWLATGGWRPDDDGKVHGEVHIWDAATGRNMRSWPVPMVKSLAFSPDGRRLAGVDHESNAVLVWDTETGTELLQLNGGHRPFSRAVFSTDGKLLAACGGGDTNGNVTVWDAATGEKVLDSDGYPGRILSLAFTPDGKRLALGSYDHTVTLCDPRTGRNVLVLRGHPDLVTGVAFSPDGCRLASVSKDRTLKIWDATPLQPAAK